jgi:spore coat polysaccharide biosynthesis protein SpsF
LIITLIQTRLKSSRLERKCIKSMAGHPMTSYTIEGAKQSKLNHFTGIIYPSSDNMVFSKLYSDKCFCYSHEGDEADVLNRYYAALNYIQNITQENITNVVRITSDCPMLGFYPKVIDEVILKHLLNNADFTHNRGENGLPSGLDVEIMKSSVLAYVNNVAEDKEDREHVTTFIKKNPEKFKIYEVNSFFQDFKYKWSVDTLEDFRKVEDIVKILKIRREYER